MSPIVAEDRIPLRAVVISALALGVAVLGNLVLPPVAGEHQALLWLLALVPAFLLAYYRGWKGVAAALAVGMAAISFTEAFTDLPAVAGVRGLGVTTLIASYIGICLGIGWLSEALHGRRHVVEGELRHTLDWLEAVVEGARDAIFISDEDARFVRVNRAASELTGYSQEELLEMRIPDLHEEADLHTYRKYHAAILEGRDVVSEARIVGKDGSKVDTEFNSRRIHVGDRPYMHTVSRDITDRKDRDARLQRVQSMEALGQLTGGIAHDFNNLLTVIGANAELLGPHLGAGGTAGEGGPEEEEGAALLEALQAGVASASSLVRKLLAFGRQTPIHRAPMDLAEFVQTEMRTLRRVVRENVDIRLHLQEDLPLVLADSGSLQQILVNLVVNAQDAMPSGGTVRIAVDRCGGPEGNASAGEGGRSGAQLRLSVADTGVGMDEVTRRHIFEPLFTTKEVGKGTGLGLAVVQELVREHEGEIEVKSRPGEGTTMVISLPVTKDARAAETEYEEPQILISTGDEVVLLVEDDAGLRAAGERTLARLGYQVVLALDGEDALRLMADEARKVDLVLTDWMMPGMTGVELIEYLTERSPALPCILSSGYPPDEEGLGDSRPASMRFLQKPWSLPELALAVRKALDG